MWKMKNLLSSVGGGNAKKDAKPAAAAAAAPAAGAGASGNINVTLDDAISKSGNKLLCLDDFQLLKVLGRGSFGKVMLVKKKDNGKIYAMKTLRKAALVKRNQLLHTQTERYILQNIRNPFLVNLQYAFQTPDKLYMVLDFCAGGEVFFWLREKKRFTVEQVRLFAAELILGLEALHSRDIIYRDLKPENILMDSHGHLKLTDFGLSKEGVKGSGAEGGATTFCGTPEYLAPELLEQQGHGKAVDWWSLGTMLYEMLNGLPPFYDTNMQAMYSKILSKPLTFNEKFPQDPHVRSLLAGLLTRDVGNRLGSGPGDAEEIKAHPFFANLNWRKVMERKYVPDFRPPVNEAALEKNFDTQFTSEKVQDSVVTSNLSAEQQATVNANFKGFTYQGNDTLEG